jgi:hypothetical protein
VTSSRRSHQMPSPSAIQPTRSVLYRLRHRPKPSIQWEPSYTCLNLASPMPPNHRSSCLEESEPSRNPDMTYTLLTLDCCASRLRLEPGCASPVMVRTRILPELTTPTLAILPALPPHLWSPSAAGLRPSSPFTLSCPRTSFTPILTLLSLPFSPQL